MKHIKLNLLILKVIILTSFSSCISNEKKERKCINYHIGETRFTYSRDKDVDFVVSGGGYVILYDYSKPVDTIFNYCDAQKIGKDSLIYVRIRKNLTSTIPFENKNIYYGSCKGLYLYNGKTIKKLNLPYFDSHFSSFIVKDKDIYYWGGVNSNYKINAVKYNFKTKKHIIKNTEIEAGTDYYAHFFQPYIYNKTVTFKVEGGDFCQYDLNLNLVKKKITDYRIFDNNFDNDTLKN